MHVRSLGEPIIETGQHRRRRRQRRPTGGGCWDWAIRVARRSTWRAPVIRTYRFPRAA